MNTKKKNTKQIAIQSKFLNFDKKFSEVYWDICTYSGNFT